MINKLNYELELLNIRHDNKTAGLRALDNLIIGFAEGFSKAREMEMAKLKNEQLKLEIEKLKIEKLDTTE